MGGIPTKEEGRFVSWGNLYRSGELSELTKDDLAYLKHLDITSVDDLRNDVEIEDKPDKIPANAKYFHIPIGDKEGKEYRRLKRKLIFGGMRRQKAKAEFINIMKAFADSAATDFKPVVDQMIKEERVPLVFHCSGGKDRTGFLAALIYAVLNVDRDVIRNEYMMSNYYRYEKNKRLVKKARWLGLDAETMEYAFLVREEYLDAAFDLIDAEYGDMDTYFEKKFGLTPLIRQELIDKFTYLMEDQKEEQQPGDSTTVAGPSIGPAEDHISIKE